MHPQPQRLCPKSGLFMPRERKNAIILNTYMNINIYIHIYFSHIGLCACYYMCISVKYIQYVFTSSNDNHNRENHKTKGWTSQNFRVGRFWTQQKFFPIVLLNEHADVVTLKAWGLVMYPQKSSSSTLPSWSEQRLSCTFRYNTGKKW